MSVTIRPAIATDAPALSRIAHAAKRHWGYPACWIQAWRDELTITGTLIAEHSLWVAELRGKSVGLYADPNASGFYERMGAVQVGAVDASMEGVARERPQYMFDLTTSGAETP